MNQTQNWKTPGYEKVVFCENPTVGLKAIIAIHNTNRGPSCGGIRLLPYQTNEEALNDVLRLSKGMSYKSALAEIGFGGGKSVIILDPARKSQEIFHAFAEFVDSFGGEYIAAKDMNITSADLATVKEKTPHVLGIDGEKGSSGDPSPVTARGLYQSLRATVEEIFQSKSLSGIKIAFQGIGHVGYRAAELAREAGAEIWVTDTNPEIVKKAQAELKATAVGLEEIYDVKCDIFSPCARGGTLNEKTIPRLKCRAIVGAANNQLAVPADGMRLHESGIFYAPDFAVNAGGIINIFIELDGYNEKKALAKADGIYDTIKEIISRSRSEKLSPSIIADKMAEERLNVR